MVKASRLRKALVARYRAVLREGPSDDALRESISLAQDVAGLRFDLAHIESEIRTLDHEEALERRLQSELSEDVLEFARSRYAEIAASRTQRRAALERRRLLEETSATMILPSYVRAHGIDLADADASLLVDAELVVFHQAYFGYIVEPSRAQEPERKRLVEASIHLSEHVPPADRARMRAMIFDAQGEHRIADSFYREALALTTPQSHEFMTVLQSAWSSLVEQQRFADALLLLQSQVARIPASAIGEFEEILLMTTRLQRAA